MKIEDPEMGEVAEFVGDWAHVGVFPEDECLQ